MNENVIAHSELHRIARLEALKGYLVYVVEPGRLFFQTVIREAVEASESLGQNRPEFPDARLSTVKNPLFANAVAEVKEGRTLFLLNLTDRPQDCSTDEWERYKKYVMENVDMLVENKLDGLVIRSRSGVYANGGQDEQEFWIFEHAFDAFTVRPIQPSRFPAKV